jgi:nitrate/TMAO reductase-like tetraheme cytochrome c subunit
LSYPGLLILYQTGTMFKKRIIWVMIAMMFFVFSGTVSLQRCKPNETKDALPKTGNNEFAGEQSCKSCHASGYNEWLQSLHFMAIQPASDSTVVGDFNNLSIQFQMICNRITGKHPDCI